MEIKRRLTKIAKSLSPQIEVMNVGLEMDRMCSRFEELVAYAQEKIERAAEKTETIGARVDREKREQQQAVADQQVEESQENLKDQEESAAERQALMDKSKKSEPEPEPMPDMSKKPTHPKKKAKELAKKKK